MSASRQEAPEFGKLRSILWPIHNFEMKKFVPMFFMFFFVSFNYSILRITKDSLIVNAPGSGAEALPYLKLWCTTPAAILFMVFYVKLAGILSRKNLFYAALAPFFLFFVAFPYLLYPAIDVLHPTTSADWLASVLPQGLNGLISVYRNWVFSLFYVLAELWGSVVLSTLYWGFANEITKVGEAKRFYGLLGIGANLALLFVSPAIKFAKHLGDWSDMLLFVMNLAIVGCIGVAVLYWYVTSKVMSDPRFAVDEPKQKKSKVKMGFFASVRELAKSRYLACLAIMVLAYGVSINLVEVTWKNSLKDLFAGDMKEFIDFQASVMSFTGISTILLMYFGTSNVLRRYGWGVAALLTPIMMLVTSLIFFTGLGFQDSLTGIIATMGTTPLWIAACVGGAQNVLSKATKYSFFDPTKELAYIPLDEQSKRTGKAAIDGVGGRLGKSGGSLVNMILIGLLGSVTAITPYVALVTLGIIGIWIVCARSLNKQFVALTEETSQTSSLQVEANKLAAHEKAEGVKA